MWFFIILGIIVFIVLVSNSSDSKSSSNTTYNKSSSYNSPNKSSSTSGSTMFSSSGASTGSTLSKSSIGVSPNAGFIPNSTVKFQSVEKGGVNCYYLYDYYPKNRFPDILGEHHENRITVWNFKDGRNSSYVANMISSAIINHFGRSNLSSKTFCIIPASTGIKTSARYSTFCSKVSSYTGVINGYSILSNLSDRDAIHNGNDRSINHSNYINFGNVSGKDIILFDDVITTGSSFKNLRSTLLNMGARNVTGIFLAKTVSTVGYLN